MLADELISLHESPREVLPFTDRYPDLTAEGGYAAARALHAHRVASGWHPAGRKIGFTNRTIWPRYGIYEPMWGTVYDRTLIYAQRDQAAVDLAGLINPRIEPEICFSVNSVPQPGGSAEEILASIDWMAHAFEIVQCYHPGWRFKLPDCTAANGLHARLVVGTPVPLDQVPGVVDLLPKVEAVLYKEDVEVDRGVGANVLDSPLLALVHFVNLLAKQPEAPPLTAGEVITTGVLTDAHPVAPGQTWRTDIRGLALHGLTTTFV